MNTTSGPSHHTFLTRARPFEPPAVPGCVRHGHHCGSQNGGAPGRRRPFPRSLGSHPGLGSHPSMVRPAASPHPSSTVPDDARRAAEQAVRILLEVLDRRRPADRMGKLFSPTVIESVRTIVRTDPPGHKLGPATGHRVHLVGAAPDATELFGTYNRGARVFAMAARLEYRSRTRRTGWAVTSLRVR